MNDEIFSDIQIEDTCRERFGVGLDIIEVISRAVPVSASAKATLFKAKPSHMYLYIISPSHMLLDDVRKIVQRMNLEADEFLPPFREEDYFERVARDKFKVMFPGKRVSSDEDLRYYKNLAPYNPALVRIAKVKGEVRGFDISTKAWRKVKDYTYAKMKVT